MNLFEANQTCVRCHFFVKTSTIGGKHVFGVNNDERELARNDNFEWAKQYSLSCYFGVWTEGYEFSSEDRHQIIVHTNRKDFCFFWKYRPGMLLPAAKILQEREANNREAAKDRRRTIFGLWIAAIALIIDALSKFINNP